MTRPDIVQHPGLAHIAHRAAELEQSGSLSTYPSHVTFADKEMSFRGLYGTTEVGARMAPAEAGNGDSVLFRGNVGAVVWHARSTWLPHGFNSLTSYPDFSIVLDQEGPDLFDTIPPDVPPYTVSEISGGLIGPTPREGLRYFNTMTYDPGSRIVTLSKGIPYDNLTIDATMRVRSRTKDNSHNIPSLLYDSANPTILREEGFNYVPALAEVVSGLGIQETGTTRSFASPNEFGHRMDCLRSTNTSGLYLPDLLFAPVEQFDAPTYINGVARKKRLIATKNLFWYMHDAAGDHIKADMEYGDPYVDMLAAYAQAQQATGDPEILSRSTDVLDEFSGKMGKIGLHRELPSPDFFHTNSYSPFNDIVQTLRRANRLSGLDIVQWMQGKGVGPEDTDKLKIEDLYTGLRTRARERLKVA